MKFQIFLIGIGVFVQETENNILNQYTIKKGDSFQTQEADYTICVGADHTAMNYIEDIEFFGINNSVSLPFNRKPSNNSISIPLVYFLIINAIYVYLLFHISLF